MELLQKTTTHTNQTTRRSPEAAHASDPGTMVDTEESMQHFEFPHLIDDVMTRAELEQVFFFFLFAVWFRLRFLILLLTLCCEWDGRGRQNPTSS